MAQTQIRDEQLASAIDAAKIADGSVTNAEFQRLDATSSIQTQLDGKQSTLTNSAGLAAALSDETGSGAAVFATSPTLVTPILGTPTSGTLTNCTGLPLAGVVDSTTEALGVGSLEIGHASDTTIARSGAGDITIEGNAVYRASGTDVAVADGGTGASTAAAARTNLGVMHTVVLASDVVNNDATPNTIADITGLSFSVVTGETYYFRFTLDYTANATTTGARLSVNGPAATRLAYRSIPTTTTTSQGINHGLTSYDLPAAANASSASTGGNIGIVEGFVTPSADGTVIGRFASEVASAAITIKAGSILQWYRCL